MKAIPVWTELKVLRKPNTEVVTDNPYQEEEEEEKKWKVEEAERDKMWRFMKG